jgi:hypothetical protein
MLFVGLRFPLHPVLVDILWYFDIYPHQLTPTPSYAFRCKCGYVELPVTTRPGKYRTIA